jgi:hypothetical protein
MSTEEESNNSQKTEEMKRVLIFGGKTGWIGQMMGELVGKEGESRSSPLCCHQQLENLEWWPRNLQMSSLY